MSEEISGIKIVWARMVMGNNSQKTWGPFHKRVPYPDNDMGSELVGKDPNFIELKREGPCCLSLLLRLRAPNGPPPRAHLPRQFAAQG